MTISTPKDEDMDEANNSPANIRGGIDDRSYEA